MKDTAREEIIQQDIRALGGFSNFAISFSIISILTGAILLYGFGLWLAGPVINTIGWPLVSVFVLIIAASMAEIASAYPAAGGPYDWAHRLGGHRWAWMTAWFNMIGQITLTSGINIAAAIYIIGAVTHIFNLPANASVPVFGSPTNWYFYVFIMVMIMVPQILINLFGGKLTARLSDVSVGWHIGGVLIIALLLTLFGKTHNPLSFALQLTNTTNPYDFSSATLANGASAPALYLGGLSAGRALLVVPSPLFAILPFLTALYKSAPIGLVFAIGLLQAQWTYTGYDASAHVAEETYLARMNSAWGLFLSVAVSAVVGYIVLMALTLAITDLPSTATDAYPVLKIAYDNLNTFMANLVAVIIAGAMWLCGLASITSMSRTWSAFARVGGMPGHSLIRQLHRWWRTPVNSILITCALAVIMLLWSGAYSVVAAISVIMLYWAYGLPIFLNLRNKLQKRGEYTTHKNAPWSLKRWGVPLNLLSVVWILIISVALVLPPNELALWTTVLICVFMLAYWQLDVKKRFSGPSPTDEAELPRIEAEMMPGAQGRGGQAATR